MTKWVRKLERELARKEKALAEAAALLVLNKVDLLYPEDEDDDRTGERRVILDAIAEAQRLGARLAAAYSVVGISPRTAER